LAKDPSPDDRRAFLKKVGTAAAALCAKGAVGETAVPPEASLGAVTDGAKRRSQEAFRIRAEAALRQKLLPRPAHPTNGDEARYPSRIASYTKALPHDDLGEVDPAAYGRFVDALESGEIADLDRVPMGDRAKLADPLCAYAFTLEGTDSHQLSLPAPPAFESAEEASEMAEVYWAAYTRDVAFSTFATDGVMAQAAADLSAFSDFRGPKAGGAVTPATLFRGSTPGDLTGPYLSQLLFRDIPYGPMTLPQRYRVPEAGQDFLTNYPEWLGIQRGVPSYGELKLDPTTRYLRNGRDLSEYVHRDFSYQAFLNGALILLGLGARPDAANPYRTSPTQSGFASFGGPHLLDLVARAANQGLRAAWYQKWIVHRRLRPDAYSGRVHNHLTRNARYPIREELLKSQVLPLLNQKNLGYLLPMAYPEGCPTHPAYPAGHATIAGACVTILKAWFDESFVLSSPVEAAPDGLSLVPYTGGPLTLGGELNKLASNVSLGRDTAGVHWRTDGTEGMRLGEAVAISLLRDHAATYGEPFDGFSLTRFDGTHITL